MVVITNYPPPTEGVRHEEPNTSALIKQRNLGKGTLYVAESRVAWVSEKGEGFSLEYPSISLHAVSRDLSSFPHECLYLMIASTLEDEDLAWVSEKGEGFSLEYPSISLHAVSRDLSSFPHECLYLMRASTLEDEDLERDDESSEEDDNEDYDELSEIRFIPENSSTLDVIFKAMSECQALHPDDDVTSGDEEDGIYDDAEDDHAEDDDAEDDVGAAEEVHGASDVSEEPIGYSNGQVEEEPMDVGQFDDAEPEH